MAWRIHDNVIRGELDNRIKGLLRGKLWLYGVSQPITLELRGNAHPDLAGCLLKFHNPLKTVPIGKDAHFSLLQRGQVGDVTASRKVRVFDVPLEQALEMVSRKEKPPEHLANSLYVEWFSNTNGRVVIESTDYVLESSGPEWQMSKEEDQMRAREAANGFDNFMQKLSDAITEQQRGQKDPREEPWDEHDYEKFLKECDARTDKYMELLEKYGDSEEADDKIAREMGWDEDDKPIDEDDERTERLEIEEINRACEEALQEPPPQPAPEREGIDWIRTENGKLRHPLQHRCSQSAMELWRLCDQLGHKSEDTELQEFLFEFQTTSVKLGGALTALAEGRAYRDAAFTVACLKRALGHLHKAQAALERVAPKMLFPKKIVAKNRQELLEIRQGILQLMDRFRGRN